MYLFVFSVALDTWHECEELYLILADDFPEAKRFLLQKYCQMLLQREPDISNRWLESHLTAMEARLADKALTQMRCFSLEQKGALNNGDL